MVVSPSAETRARWLLLVFSLPAKKASQRVEIWRLLKRYGSVGLRSSGYVLPNNSQNLERFEWLAANVRKYRGEASVIHIESIDNLPSNELSELFLEARGRDYEAMILELKRYKAAVKPGQLSRLRRRFQEISAIDFFNSPLRSRVEQLLANADARQDNGVVVGTRTSRRKKEFQKRTWMTRPRPGIDRVSSAWLILRFIDPQARFTFGTHTGKVARAVPFDMFSRTDSGIAGMTALLRLCARSFKSPIPR